MKSRYPKMIIKGFALALVTFLILGFVLPTVTSIITEGVAPWQSSGHPVKIGGKVYGSYLLAEAFNSSIFFQPRPSGTDYNLSQSGAYSYSLNNPKTLNLTQKYIEKFMQENPGINESEIPYEMVSYSASGLDPNIPLQGAVLQVHRIAESIHSLSVNESHALNISAIEQFLNESISANRQQNFPLFGSYYVNTVTLNFDIINMLMDRGVISSSFLD